MKLEPNMYVRMASGRIAKIDSIEDNIIEFDNWIISTYDDYLNSFTIDSPYLKQIIKASHNIIDLIELGDYVNGYKVVSKGTLSSESDKKYLAVLTNDYGNFWSDKIFEQDIKTILTKEQFENNCYKIGDE